MAFLYLMLILVPAGALGVLLALWFTQHGPAAAYRTEVGERFVLIAVEDNGSGVAPAMQQKISPFTVNLLVLCE